MWVTIEQNLSFTIQGGLVHRNLFEECVSVTYLTHVHLRSSKSRFPGKVWTGSIYLSILRFSMAVKAMGLHVTTWGWRVAREKCKWVKVRGRDPDGVFDSGRVPGMCFLIWFPSVFRVRKGEGPAEEPGTEQLGEGEERCYVPEDKLRKGSGWGVTSCVRRCP